MNIYDEENHIEFKSLNTDNFYFANANEITPFDLYS